MLVLTKLKELLRIVLRIVFTIMSNMFKEGLNPQLKKKIKMS